MMLFSPDGDYTTIQSSTSLDSVLPFNCSKAGPWDLLTTAQTVRATPSDRYLDGTEAKVACYIPKFTFIIIYHT